jgi:hypothetical protein
MRIVQVVAQVVTDPFAAVPWPAQLGLIGALIVTIVLILRWQNQQVQKGNLVPRASVDEVVKSLNAQIIAEQARAEEWREAHTLSEKAREVERDTTRAAVQSNRLQEAYMDRFVSDLGTLTGGASPSRNVTTSGDNTVVEGKP